MPSKHANGDMIQYFSDHPDKLREKQDRDRRKALLKKMMKRRDPDGIEKKAQPTQAQAEAGNYKKKHIRYNGMEISIENPAGSVRSGVSKNGTEWRNKMNHHYGYIRKTDGRDGDHVDVFIKPGTTETKRVFVVDQTNEKGEFDEHKCMLGFDSESEAKKAYLSNYDKGWKCGPISELSIEEFKDWVYDGKKKKPAEEFVAKREKLMDKKAYLEDVYKAAFNDELSKIASLTDVIKAKKAIQKTPSILSDAWKSQMSSGRRIVGGRPVKKVVDLNKVTNFGMFGNIARPSRGEVMNVISRNLKAMA